MRGLARTRRAVVEGLTLTGVAVLAACALSGRRSGRTALMYGHVDLPAESFSFSHGSVAPQCEDGCAFQDKVFTVEGWNELCLAHCGEIDAMLRDASKGQRQVCVRLYTHAHKHARTRALFLRTRTHAHSVTYSLSHTHMHTLGGRAGAAGDAQRSAGTAALFHLHGAKLSFARHWRQRRSVFELESPA
jgi:hypothetical protein